MCWLRAGSANATLDLVYYFRWRTYRSHIHATNRADDVPFVVTEFSRQARRTLARAGRRTPLARVRRGCADTGAVQVPPTPAQRC